MPPEPSEQPNEQLTELLEELARKGYTPAQLKVVRVGWEKACQGGAHPQLAAAVRAETRADALRADALRAQAPEAPTAV